MPDKAIAPLSVQYLDNVSPITGQRFLTRSRVFTDEEVISLS